MAERVVRGIPSIGQILLILMGIILLYSLADFGRQIGVLQQQRRELQRLDDRVSTAQQRQTELGEALVYVQSDAAAEEWARTNGLAKEGEVPVVVVAPDEEVAQPQRISPTQSLTPDAYRETWWDLFFGNR
jgi:hypothetical protein